jgi:hypothetical protein
MVWFFLHTGLRDPLIGLRLHRKALSWRLWMLFRMRWVRRSIRQKLLGIIAILEHSGPEVGVGEIAVDFPQSRFWIASCRHPCKSLSRGNAVLLTRASEERAHPHSPASAARNCASRRWFLPSQNRTSIRSLGPLGAVTED